MPGWASISKQEPIRILMVYEKRLKLFIGNCLEILTKALADGRSILLFKVICLVGMDSDAYPRRSKSVKFDLMAGNPRPVGMTTAIFFRIDPVGSR